MNNDKKQPDPAQDQKQNPEPLPVHKPFEPGDDKPISQEDIDNEQKLKEAMSERD